MFTKILRQLMDERGWSQVVLAKAIGAPQQSISRWLGGTKPDIDSLCDIATCFDVSVDYLCGRTSRPADLQPGKWLIDSDMVREHRKGRKIKPGMKTLWAVAIPERFRIVTSAEYQALRIEFGLD